MYGVEIFIEGKWMLIETGTRNLTDMLYDRALERQHVVRRVMLIDYGTIMLDSESD